MSTEIALSLLFGLLDRAQSITALMQTAKAQNRDITEGELDQLIAADEQARSELLQAIAAAKA